MRINHNVSAQLANVNLKRSDRRLSSSLERLSSGYKINKAADDSAGLAISNKMRTQIRALDQASRNAADGESVIQIAEGALGEVENILQRIHELAVQAANDVYNLDDRQSIQMEVDEMLDEIDRISETTEFNGHTLLDGSAARTIFSDNAGVNAMTASMQVLSGEYSVKVDQLGAAASTVLTYTIPGPGEEPYNIGLNGYTLSITSNDTDASVQEKVMNMCDPMNIDVEQQAGGGLKLTTRAAGSSQLISVQYPGEETRTDYRGKDAKITLGDGFNKTATYDAQGNYITIIDNGGFQMQLSLDSTVTGTFNLNVYDAGYMTLQIGANEHQTLDMDFPEVSCANLNLRDINGNDSINLCSQAAATTSIDRLSNAIQNISNTRSTLGAYENRLESTISSLDISSENVTGAMSRIFDTDIADEMTQYTQQDVLSQVATSMLTQANNRPQQVMNLLQS